MQNDLFEIIGLPPTTDIKEVEKAYIIKVKHLHSLLAKARTNGEDITKYSKELSKLNEAYNTLKNINLDDYILELEAQKLFSEVAGEDESMIMDIAPVLGMDLYNTPQVKSLNVDKLIESLKVKWKDPLSPMIEEVITLKDFLRGSVISTPEGMIEIPKGFLGVMTRMIEKTNQIQFIKVTGKNSIILDYNSRGDLALKSLPKNDKTASFENNILKFSYSDVEFQLDLSQAKDIENGMKVIEGKGILPFKGKKPGDFYFSKYSLSKTGVLEDVYKYLFG
mgnify:CR=1 FL=1